jgi:hypothetical protein
MNPRHLLIGTTRGLYTSDPRAPVQLDGRPITALATESGALWAIVDGEELWHRTHAGRWKLIASASPWRALCVLPSARGTYVGTAEAHLLRLADDRLVRVDAFDAVPGRDAWFTPWGGPPDTRSLAAGGNGDIYVNVHVGGVVRSRDAGRTWEPTLDIDSDVHQVLTTERVPRLVLAASAVGLGISRNGGDSWHFATAGLHALYQRAVAVVPDAVLVSTARSERGQQSAVYRRSMSGRGPFRKCERGLPTWFPSNINTGCLVASGETAAIGSPDGVLYMSDDAGESWRLVREGLPKIGCLVFAGG